MDFTRAKALGSIQRDQRASTQTLEWREYAVCLDRFEKQRIERGWRGAVEHLAEYLKAHHHEIAQHVIATETADLSALTEPEIEAIAKRHMITVV